VYENIAVSSKHPTLIENIMQIAAGRVILDNKKIYDIIEIFDLGKYVNSTAGSLPYGLQRRLELARCLATNPSFIILDEPIAGMNEAEIQEMGRIIRHINSLGITIHISFVMGLCTQVFVMDKGKIISSGTPQHVSADPIVREAYFG
jgi:ABC-type branched-subunit amino acid transport system ATPase component